MTEPQTVIEERDEPGDPLQSLKQYRCVCRCGKVWPWRRHRSQAERDMCHDPVQEEPMRKFNFHVSGTEYRPHSTLMRQFDDEYDIVAESAPEALLQLINRDLWWDTLDIDQPFSIEIVSIEDATEAEPEPPEHLLTESQQRHLLHLRDRGALPDSGYWFPLWDAQYANVDGRGFAALVKRGWATRIEALDGRGAYQLTVAGYRLAEETAAS